MSYSQVQHAHNKSSVGQLTAALYNFDPERCLDQLKDLFHDNCAIRLSHPLGDMTGAAEFVQNALLPLQSALPDLERRDYIGIAGTSKNAESGDSNQWVGSAGYYTGVFTSPWLDIPPTGHQISMRFHEFYRFRDGKIAEIQALWDIVDVMRQANALSLIHI